MKKLIIGLIIGLVIGIILSSALNSRYKIINGKVGQCPVILKVDSWTGKSWELSTPANLTWEWIKLK